MRENNTEEIHLTEKQNCIHTSLPMDMGINLENVYNLVEIRKESEANYLRTRCCIGLAFAVVGAALGISSLYQ